MKKLLKWVFIAVAVSLLGYLAWSLLHGSAWMRGKLAGLRKSPGHQPLTAGQSETTDTNVPSGQTEQSTASGVGGGVGVEADPVMIASSVSSTQAPIGNLSVETGGELLTGSSPPAGLVNPKPPSTSKRLRGFSSKGKKKPI